MDYVSQQNASRGENQGCLRVAAPPARPWARTAASAIGLLHWGLCHRGVSQDGELLMTTEVWLRTNARAMAFGMVLPIGVAALGAVLLFGVPGHVPALWIRAVGVLALGLGLLLAVGMLAQLWRPRLAYCNGQLLVGLTAGAPLTVPIEHVECFWIGQAPALLPGKSHRHVDAASLVVRIAESAADWHQRDVKPQLGAWCGGYITIRGTWCEPLSVPLVNRLNERLAEVTRAITR